MKDFRFILPVVAVVLSLGVLITQLAQNAFSEPQSPDQQRRGEAMGLLRTINTAEVVERISNGSYSAWPTLLAHQQKKFDQWLAMQGPNVRLGDMPEILPGWKLRLNVHADGQGYDSRLQDTTSKNWATFSDESGVIWVGEPLQ